MAIHLPFDYHFRYTDSEEGITVPVSLAISDTVVDTSAKIDTGAGACLFSREVGMMLGLDIEQGFARYLGLPRNILGRQGWIRKFRLGLVNYECLLYLSPYDS